MNVTTFRQDFPEFASATDYPDTQVNFWLGLGGKLLNADRWADMLDYALELFTAHHLAIQRRDQLAVTAGGVPGLAMNGPLSSKSVDKVSASYDTGAITLADAGFWNATSYGIRFYQLALMFGAGGIQL